MKKPAYPESYLYDAMKNLGECIDYAVNKCGFDPDVFMRMFINTGVAERFETGDPFYIFGMSGTEAAIKVLSQSTDIMDFPEPIISFQSSPEYWCGWVLSIAQWQEDVTFGKLSRVISWSEVISKYNPYHEADESKFIDELIKPRLLLDPTYRRLKEYRRRLGMSQRDLSEASGVNLRTLQQYEIGAKDLNKASFATVSILAKCLNVSLNALL